MRKTGAVVLAINKNGPFCEYSLKPGRVSSGHSSQAVVLSELHIL